MTDMDNQVVVSDYAAMDRVIQKASCYVLLCAAHPEVHPARRSLLPGRPLLRQDEDHGGEGHQARGRGLPVQDYRVPADRLIGPLHCQEHGERRCGGGFQTGLA